MAAAGAECSAESDLTGPLQYGYQRDVGDSDRADQERDPTQDEEQRVEVALYTVFHQFRFWGRGDLHP